MRRLPMILFFLNLIGGIPAVSMAHMSLDFPNGGETYTAGEVVTIQWHIYISHNLVNWDLWYSTDDSVDTSACGDQPNFTWNVIEMDVPRTCTNAGGGCGVPGGCTMQYQWTIPENLNSTDVKIRVRMDNTATDYYDVSDAPFTVSPSSSAGDLLSARGVTLWQNYPNPVLSTTTLPFALLQTSEDASLNVYDASGRRVRTLFRGAMPAGVRFLTWNGTDDQDSPVASGVYFCRLQAGERMDSKKLVLIK